MKKTQEKTLLRKVIEVYWEQLQRRKALRLLSKQEWSLDFLTALLVKASKLAKQKMELVITEPNGRTIHLLSSSPVSPYIDDSDDIMQHLDDPAAVDEYIRRNGR